MLLWSGASSTAAGAGRDCKPAPHLTGIAMLPGGPRKEPGPALPSGMSLFPTGFYINEVITVVVMHLCLTSLSFSAFLLQAMGIPLLSFL